ALADRRAGVGKIVVELGEGDTGVFVLVGAGERHAELQKIVGRLGALWPALVALGKGGGGVEKAVAGEVGLAEPVLRVARHRVLGVLLDKGLERPFGGRIVGLLQETKGVVVLLGGRAARQDIAGG